MSGYVKFETREVGTYLNVTINVDGFIKDLCLFSKLEAKGLMYSLKDCIEDLEEYIDND